MSSVQQWASGLCLLVLAATVVQYLLPHGTMVRSMRLVLGAFLLLGILSPLTTLVRSDDWQIDWSVSSFEEGALIDSANKALIEESRKKITELVAIQAQRENVRCEWIDVSMDITEDNCIAITGVTLTIGEADGARAETLRQSIESALGIKTEVVINGGYQNKRVENETGKTSGE